MCQSVKDAGVSGRVWEGCVLGEGVGVGEDVRGCQGDGLACGSLLVGGGGWGVEGLYPQL